MGSRAALANWRQDVPASIVVALVALPLCLGVALASGAPLMAGLVAGIVGGIVVGAISGSPLSVSGPAAGLTTIVLAAITSLPSFEAFLAAVCLAGCLQLAFAASRGGMISEFVPGAVITGMLAAIGLILILKQVPHAIGYDADPEGDFGFFQPDGENTLSALVAAFRHLLANDIIWGAALIAGASLAFLFWWDKARPKEGPLRLLPGPLVVVAFGIGANGLFAHVAPGLAIAPSHLVQVPVAAHPLALIDQVRLPDFARLGDVAVWKVAATLAIVASLESLLSVKAVDELDPKRRITDKNRELVAQGCGNILSGLLGGLPVTSVIVRSSANVEGGAASRLSTILHGLWLLLGLALVPGVLNLIPLSALAAVLIATGYKLAKPALFIARWRQGFSQFVPFVVTVLAILFTDLLVGIAIGLVVGMAFVIWRSTGNIITYVEYGGTVMVRARRNLYFMHKPALALALARVPDGATLLIDLSATSYVDLDCVDVINGFVRAADYRGITVRVKADHANRTAPLVAAPLTRARAT